MTDIVIKTVDEFKRDEVLVENYKQHDEIEKKYANLFTTFDCFLNKGPITLFVPRDKDSRPKHFQQSQHHRHHTKETVRERKRKDKTIDETIMGIVNIINASNYSKMFNTIRLMSNDNNISIITKVIIVNTCNNPFYINLFTKLIIELAMISTYKEIILCELTNFIHCFIEKEEYIFKPKANNSGYDIFCDQQKHKSYVLCKNNFILKLHVDGIHKTNVTDYLNHFINELAGDKIDDEYHKTLLLQLLMDCMKQKLVIKKTSFKSIIPKLNTKEWICSRKLEFMLKEFECLIK